MTVSLNPNRLPSSSQIWSQRRELNVYTVHCEPELNRYSLETSLQIAVTMVSRFV